MVVYLISEQAVLWQVPNQPLDITPLGVLGEEIIYGNGRSGWFLHQDSALGQSVFKAASQSESELSTNLKTYFRGWNNCADVENVY